MSSIEIRPVTTLAAAANVGGSVNVHATAKGHVLRIGCHVSQPSARFVRAELRHGRREIRSVTVDGDDDLRFTLAVSSFDLPTAFDMTLVLFDAGGHHAPIATIVGHRRSHGAADGLQPILVSGLGRSGTTLLMRMLCDHPEIAVLPRYPFEARLAIYWAHLLAVSVAPADSGRPPLDELVKPRHVAPNPFLSPEHVGYDWLVSNGIELSANHIRSLIVGYYREVAGDTGKGAPRRFAEKFPGPDVPVVLDNLFPGCAEVFLVRDVRDVWCSADAFNRKRGRVRFGLEEGESPVDGMRRTLDRFWRQYDLYVDRWEPERRIVVRYEDLARSGASVLRSILRATGLAADEDLAVRLDQVAHADERMRMIHMTAPDVEASVGRWRRELPDHAVTALADDLERFCDEFDYSL